MGNIIDEKDFTIIKAKIFTPKHNFYGLMVAVMDNYTTAVGNISLVFSVYSETHDLNLTDSWDKFEKKIQDMTYSGNFSKSITASTIDKLKGDTSIEVFGHELSDNIRKNSTALISKQFQHVISKAINDTSVEVQCAFEGVTTVELQEGRLREEAHDPAPQPQGLETPSDYRLVKAKLILAPVDGKIISELREGDGIFLSLIPTTMAENTIIDKLKLRRPDGSARPAPGKIVKIQSEAKGWQLLVHIMENYYAKIYEEEKIMVKVTNSPAAGKTSSARAKTSGQKSGISWVGIGVIVLLGMVITYFAFLG